MNSIDVNDLTFGFKAPEGAWERRLDLLFMRCSSRLRRAWSWLRVLLGIALFIGTLVATGKPNLSDFGLAVGLASLWFAALWTFSGRYRITALDVPEALAQRGLKGAVLARRIALEAQALLDDVQEPDVPPAIELLPPPEGDIPGLKVTFAQVSDLIREARRRPPQIIAGEVVEVGPNAFRIRFNLQREGRFEETDPSEADRLTEVAPEAARVLIRLSAPFHAALSAYRAGNRENARRIALGAAKHNHVPPRTRAACWCLLALGWLASGNVASAARALHGAQSVDPWYPLTPLLVWQLIASDDRDPPSTSAIKQRGDVRDWYADLGHAGGGITSSLYGAFFSAAADHAVRAGKQKMLRELGDDIAKAEARMETAIQKGPTPALRLGDYNWAAERIGKAAQDLLQRYPPDPTDPPAYLEAYEQISQKISRILARMPEHRPIIENLKLEAKREEELMTSFWEETKTEDPEGYEEHVRRAEELREIAENQSAELERIESMTDQLNTYLDAQFIRLQKQLQEAQQRSKEWKALEEVPFSE